jgi:hypothetical protein
MAFLPLYQHLATFPFHTWQIKDRNLDVRFRRQRLQLPFLLYLQACLNLTLSNLHVGLPVVFAPNCEHLMKINVIKNKIKFLEAQNFVKVEHFLDANTSE